MIKKITKVKVGENEFFVHPFSAFDSIGLSGDLLKIASPILSALNSSMLENGTGDILDIEIESIAPVIAGAVQSLNGEVVKDLMRKLLLSENVAFNDKETGEAKWLKESDCDDLFEDIIEMYMLAWNVIKVNYGSFFGSQGRLFGKGQKSTLQEAKTSKNTEN